MDIFKFNSPNYPTKLEHGQIINGLKSKMWVERYDIAGEFTLVSDASSGIKDLLPEGTLISHVNTSEVMIVENHEIRDDKDKEPELVTTGRGFETFMEQRIVGWQATYPDAITLLTTGELWDHVMELIDMHMADVLAEDPENEVPYLKTTTNLTGPVDPRSRNITRGVLYTKVLELLKIDNLGIKVFRPGPTNPDGPASENVVYHIHKGVDRSDEIVFSYDTGEIESADYLWSIKKKKNAALLTGKWVQTIYVGPEVGYDRRIMEIDASSIDGDLEAAPSGGALTTILAEMQQLAIDTLASYNSVAITKTEVSKENSKAKFREDFEVGDIITVSGQYNASTKQRITEYVEIEDENGSQGYPTLSDVSEGA